MTPRWPTRSRRPRPPAAGSGRGIPDAVRHAEKWRLALEMIDEMTGPGGWGVLDLVTGAGGARPVVVADAGYGDNALFRGELAARGWRYAVAVKGTVSARPGGAVPEAMASAAWAGPACPATAPPRPACASSPSRTQTRPPRSPAAGHRATKVNPDAAMTSDFVAIRVRPASRHIPRAADGSVPECWLLAEWPPEADEPTGYWLSDLPEDTPVAELVRLAKVRWRVEHDYRELKTGLGLDHFEGRSCFGWHRHVTLAVLAQAFCTMLRTDPKVAAPG